MSAFQANATAIAYLISAVLFIFALRGLSSPESSRRGNLLGILGMVIAIVTTVLLPAVTNYVPIAVAMAVGGTVGLVIAGRIPMTAMPQLVAGFHSLVGLAAVLVASAAFLNPAAFGIADIAGNIFTASKIEMSLGSAIGAVTFSGSVIAFLKLQGLMSGTPILLPARHLINLAIGLAILSLVGVFAAFGSDMYWLGLHVFWWLTGPPE